MMNDIPKKLDSRTQPMSPANVTVHGDISKNMKVGEPVEMKILGKVRSITPNMHHADHYNIEIEEPEVEHIDNDGNYQNLAEMPKEMLKKKITRPVFED